MGDFVDSYHGVLPLLEERAFQQAPTETYFKDGQPNEGAPSTVPAALSTLVLPTVIAVTHVVKLDGLFAAEERPAVLSKQADHPPDYFVRTDIHTLRQGPDVGRPDMSPLRLATIGLYLGERSLRAVDDRVALFRGAWDELGRRDVRGERVARGRPMAYLSELIRAGVPLEKWPDLDLQEFIERRRDEAALNIHAKISGTHPEYRQAKEAALSALLKRHGGEPTPLELRTMQMRAFYTTVTQVTRMISEATTLYVPVDSDRPALGGLTYMRRPELLPLYLRQVLQSAEP